MLAAVVDTLDGGYPKIQDMAEPVPQAGEVLIAVHTAPISFACVLIATGKYQHRPATPFVAGVECSGIIERVGSDVVGFREGDRVVTLGPAQSVNDPFAIIGSFAEKVVVRAQCIRTAPDGIPLREASLFRSNYESAYFGLQTGRLIAGETLLVLGAGGGTGFAAVTIGKALGARVVGSASSEPRRRLVELAGADHVLDTRADDWRAQLDAWSRPAGISCIFDPVGGPGTERAFRALSYGGRHVVIGFAGGSIPALPTNLPLMKGAALVGANLLRARQHEPELVAQYHEQVWGLLADGRLRLPPIAREYPLEAVAEAMAAVASGESAGRVVLTINSERL